MKPGLGDQVVDYVINGEPATVLSTLSVAGGADQLRPCNIWQHNDKENLGGKRQIVILDTAPFDLDLLVRYGSVLAAVCGNTPPERALGSAMVPLALRILLTEAFLGARGSANVWPAKTRMQAVHGLTADQLVPLAEALEGTAADIFELLFGDMDNWGSVSPEHYRDLIEVKKLVQAHPEAAVIGVRRSPALGRGSFVTGLGRWDLIGKAPFLDFALELTGDASKAVREAALTAVRQVPAELIEPKAGELLSKGKVSQRAGMVTVLSSLGTETAIETLRAHGKVEKTARIVASIENALTTSAAGTDKEQSPDDASGYTAIDGSRIAIPPVRSIKTGPWVTLTREEVDGLKAIVAAENDKISLWNEEHKKTNWFRARPLLKPQLVSDVEQFIKTGQLSDKRRRHVMHLLLCLSENWVRTLLDRLSQEQALRLAFATDDDAGRCFNFFVRDVFSDYVNEYVASPEGDLRAIEELWLEMELQLIFGGWDRSKKREVERGDLLRTLIPNEVYSGLDPHDLPAGALWPYVAEHLDVLDSAFGMGGSGDNIAMDPVRALACLAQMPAPPLRYFGPILEIATGERKSGKAAARKLLEGVPEVRERLVGLLDDSRQAVRAGAAEWLGERRELASINALKKRLKKEKSDLAKAAILTALRALDEPLDDYVGPEALLREATAGLKKAKFDKLEWVQFETIPALFYTDGATVPPNVIRWWLFQAVKLKQPGGNALFEILLGQLSADSAATFSQWVLDAWIGYDTTGHSDEVANAYAEKNASKHYNMMKRWYPEYTREQAFADLRQQMKSEYIHSGSATKGMLALAAHTPPSVAAERVRNYLRNHGARTSQASALLDVLAAKGDPISLQVVISAATRLKQKSVQAYAGQLVQSVADRMNWSMDELADRIVPSAGFDDAGQLSLPCGLGDKEYLATLTDDLTIALANPEGKT
ncbi:MAG: HEAT repeat domain-containing protein, partial [Pseudomonadota bacterium]